MKRKRILIAGASGLVGSALNPFLESQGYAVFCLVRRPAKTLSEITWDPETESLNPAEIENFDVIINLCGENIADGRWSKSRKKRILESRVKSSELLSSSIAKLQSKPKAFISASGIGYYGDRADEILDENSSLGAGFLSQVVAAWENACKKNLPTEVRLVHMRFGMIISLKGGALKKMLLPFKLGLGGPFGSGKQYMSYISLIETLSIIEELIENENFSGPVNVASPNPVTNNEFTKTLAKVLKRPCLFTVPAFVLKLIFGEMAEELLLAGQRATPKKLLESNYQFIFKDLEEALRAELYSYC